MKYARTLHGVARRHPAESRLLKQQYIQYKKLKKLLKRGADAFFEALKHDVERVNCAFLDEAHRILTPSGFQWLPCCVSHQQTPPRKPVHLLYKSTKARLALLQRVVWVIAFAEVNGTALRKICKKADKLLGGEPRGQQFLQRCWSSPSPLLHAVLRSALLAELRALESRLLSTLPVCDAIPDALSITVDLRRPQHMQQREVATGRATSGADEFVFTVAGIPNEAMQCAMCMGVLFEPMSLACGHHFCAPCLLRLAGLQYHLGPFCHSWACAPRGLPCPQCRAPIVEGFNPVALPNLAQLCQQRFPDEWRARADEERKWVSELNRAWERGNPDRLPIVHHVGFVEDNWCCY